MGVLWPRADILSIYCQVCLLVNALIARNHVKREWQVRLSKYHTLRECWQPRLLMANNTCHWPVLAHLRIDSDWRHQVSAFSDTCGCQKPSLHNFYIIDASLFSQDDSHLAPHNFWPPSICSSLLEKSFMQSTQVELVSRHVPSDKGEDTILCHSGAFALDQGLFFCNRHLYMLAKSSVSRCIRASRWERPIKVSQYDSTFRLTRAISSRECSESVCIDCAHALLLIFHHSSWTPTTFSPQSPQDWKPTHHPSKTTISIGSSANGHPSSGVLSHSPLNLLLSNDGVATWPLPLEPLTASKKDSGRA